jgi:thioesterase domain-containing protein
MNPLALRLLFTVLPPVLNKMAGNSRAWDAAQQAVAVAKVAVEHGSIPKSQAAAVFKEHIEDALKNSKTPISSENFLREAALLYSQWKSGKLK